MKQQDIAFMAATNGFNPRDPHGSAATTSPSTVPSPVPLRVVYPEPVLYPPTVDAAGRPADSPSLRKRAAQGQAAYEMKFVLEEPAALELEERLRGQLAIDPHAADQLGAGYQLTTLYCDTPLWDVFHRNGRFRLFKFRLRRYGAADFVFLERKSKRGWQVRKRRSTMLLADLGKWFQPHSGEHQGSNAQPAGEPADASAARWYRSQLLRNRFRPVCQIEYQRMAYFGHGNEGPLRLTFDRQVRGAITDQWTFGPLAQPFSLLPGSVVCEFKYSGSLPAVFKAAIESMQLTPRGVSKYRHCIEAAGVIDNSSPISGGPTDA